MSKALGLRLLKAYLDEGAISEQTYKNARKWLTHKDYEPYRDQVMDLILPTGLTDAFYQIIPFGTGGRRGFVGVGTNRMNARTLGESAQGLANHILKVDKDGSLKKAGVVVGYDVRPTSREFAEITAEVLAAAGIKVYLYESPRPTPMISFAIRHLKATAGAIITASHNPPTDNGFKAYWSDGGQVVPPNDKAILAQVTKVRSIDRLPLKKAVAKKTVQLIGKKVDDAYFKCLKELVLTKPRDITIAFSPLHGTGVASVPRGLKEIGFKDVHMPEAQVKMDGTFPTVEKNYPNPEMPAAMKAVVELGREVKADIVMASDPDADRIGVFAPDGKGDFTYLTGNQMGAMMVHYICESLSAAGKMPPEPFMLTTLVTTKMGAAVASEYGVNMIDDLLVGFKWMAEVLHKREQKGADLSNFLFGFEESIGFLRGTQVRDKDAAAGALTAAQMTAWAKSKGMSLVQYLDSLYEKYGYFKETQISKFLYGSAGSTLMGKLMENFRNDPPAKIGGKKVWAIVDRQAGTRLDCTTGKTSPVEGHKSNVLIFELDKPGYTRVGIRPSGTEPKLKHYVSAYGKPGGSLSATKKKVDTLVKKLAQSTEGLEDEIVARLT